eukprot:TRINITY_DN41000_c0_g1_i1.p1 TRINITY_DN41000_c0_g1~~TRINITY_DN41000_c0_g1_i1.p1  ORF type:complete len:111 (+),score=13.73 TRINITY_DN41000_c0_g1_i1:355-687(+)
MRLESIAEFPFKGLELELYFAAPTSRVHEGFDQGRERCCVWRELRTDPTDDIHAGLGTPVCVCAQILLVPVELRRGCLLYTSDAADEEDSGDLGGRRIIKKKKRAIVKRV